MSESTKVTVEFPKEEYELIELQGDGMSAICLVNNGLVEFEQRKVFGWQFSMTIDLEDSNDKGMPTKEERAIIDPFFEKIDESLKANKNALFLGRVTWKKTQQWLWRVHNPQVSNDYIESIINSEGHPRPFDYVIDPDLEWKKAEWLLEPLKK